MSYETTLVTEVELPVNFVVANATGIEKGSFLKLTDPNTAIIHSGANDAVAGIAAAEKIASDGVTELAVYRRGIFKVYLSGSCTAGDALVLGLPANYVKTCPNYSTLSGANIVGIALETGATGETILMELSPQSVRFA